MNTHSLELISIFNKDHLSLIAEHWVAIDWSYSRMPEKAPSNANDSNGSHLSRLTEWFRFASSPSESATETKAIWKKKRSF